MTRRAEPIDRQTRSILPHARSQKGRRARGRVQVPVRPVCRAARTMLMIVTAARESPAARGARAGLEARCRHAEEMSNTEARAYLLADNRTPDLASYDEEALAAMVEAGDDLIGTGYDKNGADEVLWEGVRMHGVIIECANEAEQTSLLVELLANGRVVRVFVS